LILRQKPYRAAAAAKINLCLEVMGRREDGYHDLYSVVAFAAPLHDAASRQNLAQDVLEFVPHPLPPKASSFTLSIPNHLELAAYSGENLVLKAARAFCAHFPQTRGGHFTLHKHLPVASGIGGGSADAAAALRLLALAEHVPHDDPALFEIARHVGADVPVCLRSSAHIMQGVGDVLTPAALPPMFAVLVNPRVSVSTPDIFAAMGVRKPQTLHASPKFNPPSNITTRALVEALANSRNDLEPTACQIAPQIIQVLTALKKQSHVALARMSGSGATCFGLFETASEARAAADDLKAQHPAWWVTACQLV
jgi:4-diphosphocytidyl-2-C-methyl-D-erythritol kinase